MSEACKESLAWVAAGQVKDDAAGREHHARCHFQELQADRLDLGFRQVGICLMLTPQGFDQYVSTNGFYQQIFLAQGDRKDAMSEQGPLVMNRVARIAWIRNSTVDRIE